MAKEQKSVRGKGEPMRAIDADTLINLIPAPIYASPDGQDLVQISDVMEAIKRVPTIEPERKTGKWVHGKLIYSDISIATCTTCGKRVPVGNFCLNCGSYNSEKEK